MDKEYAGKLLQLYLKDEATHVEREALFAELEKHPDDQAWEELLEHNIALTDEENDYDPIRWRQAIAKISGRRAKIISFDSRRWLQRCAAAAIILAVLVGSYLGLNNKSENTALKTPAVAHRDIPPGHNGAILVLSNGEKIVLDSATGKIANERGVTIINKEGSVRYDHSRAAPDSAAGYNSIITPKGRQYHLVLEDGTRVWLNAASSISFPTVFTGKERRVQISGEVYFEVQPNAMKPFKVSAGDVQVEVIGTHFNINSYADEAAMKTTLLEGKVRIIKAGDSRLLTPGQQALIAANGRMSVEENVDIEAVMAWKNGLFHFENAGISGIMRQIQRWYDMEVIYPDGVPAGTYSGKISRYVNASQVFKVLEEGGLRFKVEGKKVMVLK